MKPEQFVKQLQAALPAGLRSVVLFGSAAAGDHVAGKSDYNVLIVADRLGVPELTALAGAVGAWEAAGNRPPLCFTPAELAQSARAFPIEWLDLQQWHTVLLGEDPLAAVRVNRADLGLAIERELKGKLLHLRQRYLATRGAPKAVLRLLEASLSTFLVLGRAALRLYEPEVPAQKIEALKRLAAQVPFDPDVFLTVQALKEGRLKARAVSAPALFAAYLDRVERIVAAVDQRVTTPAKGEQPS